MFNNLLQKKSIMENNSVSAFSKQQLENFFLNSNVEISIGNFIIAIVISAILAFLIKLTYVKISKSLNDKEHFSETFVPLAIITTLVITVVKFSLALSLGLVGALSIVRFRAAIKEPEKTNFYNWIIKSPVDIFIPKIPPVGCVTKGVDFKRRGFVFDILVLG